MDLSRLRAPEWIALVAGALLLGSLFVPWYSTTVDVPELGATLEREFTAWDLLTLVDLLLALVALVALALAVVTGLRESPAGPVAAGVLTVSFGALGVLLVVFRLLDLPGEPLSRELGGFLALAAAIAILAAGWLSIRDETSPGRRRIPRVERRAAPPA